MCSFACTIGASLALVGVAYACNAGETNAAITETSRPVKASTTSDAAQQPAEEEPSNADTPFDFAKWKRADERIRRLGGGLCDRTPWEPGRAYVGFFSKDFSDKGLEQLKGMREIGVLNVQGTQVTDVGLEHLKDMTQLRTLYLGHTQITDAGLRHLKGLVHLRCLELRGTKVTDAGLLHLTGFAQLERLYLGGSNVTYEGVKRLRQALPKCNIDWKPPTKDERQSPAAPGQLR